jgi:tRNA threonylcarbamoyladenosine biosynthesis protein TsaB
MKTLAITTSTNRCGVALVGAAGTLAERRIEQGRLHAERIFSMIDEVLAEAGCTKRELELIACDVGPGSFTGVRVGLATAKGIALGLGISIVGVGSLEAMAHAAHAHGTARVVVAVLDARRGERFVGGQTSDGETFAARQVANAELAALVASLGADSVWCGEGTDDLESARCIDDSSCRLPDAAWIGRLGAERVRARGPDDLASLEPVYVRGPDAKLPAAAPDYRLR